MNYISQGCDANEAVSSIRPEQPRTITKDVLELRSIVHRCYGFVNQIKGALVSNANEAETKLAEGCCIGETLVLTKEEAIDMLTTLEDLVSMIG